MKKLIAIASLAAAAFAATASETSPQLYMAGDSIMTEYGRGQFPQYGWGQALKSFMKDPSALHNFARCGWSARRFRESGRWEECIASKLKPGDWVIASFGHNDMNKRRKGDYTELDAYKAVLAGFAADVRAKGANIAFATSVAHSDGFTETDGAMHVDGGFTGLGPYVEAMREAAAENGVPLLDLNRYAEENLPKLGLETAKSLYMVVEPGECPNYPKGKQDPAHLRDRGAYFYAKAAVEMARAQGLSLAELCKDPAEVPFVATVKPEPKASDFKFKLTGVAVANDSDFKFDRVCTPDTRIVVKSDKQLAMFFLEYDLPTNVSARIWLQQNCTSNGTGGRFGSSPSGLHSGKGETRRILHLGTDCHDRHVHLKSVRLSVTLENDKGREYRSIYVCDVPVDVVYASGEVKDGDEFEELEPLPPPPPVTTTLLPGWTEDLEAAKAKAKKEGKLVLGYFLNSRKGEGVLDHAVLGSRDFVERAEKSYVLYMCELDDTKQAWDAQGNIVNAFRYAARRNRFTAPEMAIVDADGMRVALLDRDGWEGGADGFLAKIEKARQDGEAAIANERKAREEAAKKVPVKTDFTSTPAGFTDNLDEALARAKAGGKLVFACFSGSDWCGWCKRLEKEVLSDPLFVVGARDDFELVFIDSPHNEDLLSDHAKAANEKLVEKYGIEGFPMVLILDGDGNRVGETGYRRGGALKYVEHLKQLKERKSAEKLGPATFSAVSPDGLNELKLEVGPKGMAYSVWRRGKALVEPTGISLWTKEHGNMNGAGAKPRATARKVEGTVATPIYKKAKVELAANETRVDFGDWALVLHARDDGVAWRFETKFEGEVTVTAENTSVRFPKETTLCYGQVGGFATSFEKPATIGPVSSVKPGHPQIVITPFAATVPGAGVVAVTESNLLDYPGLNFYRKDGENDALHSWQAGVPSETERKGRWIRVNKRHPYLAKTSGTRAYPWRVFVLGDTPSDLVSADTVYALAEPSRLADASWVKPGLVQWDWWHGFKITDVPGLKTGCNYETYKAYIDYASANGIPYIIMDEGWSEHLNLDKPRDVVNVEGVIEYGKEKGVGVILWAAWSMLSTAEDRARIFARYSKMGAKGFKIDFMDRDDQDLERFLEATAADAAAHRLVVMYHGIHKPTGLCRTYPNVLNYEGVYGLEQGHRRGGQQVVVANDVNLPYTRMVAGAMDYTPGAMHNRAFNAPEFQQGVDAPACYGTRCHQLALFPLFEAPVQMLCDSPTQYRTAAECFAFMSKVPTTWDDTVGVAGEIGQYAAIARRKGDAWWLGAISNWEARELELATGFLGEGEWRAEVFEDAPDADVNAEHYVHRIRRITAGAPLKVRLAPGGGFAAKFTRATPIPAGDAPEGFTTDFEAAISRAAERGVGTLVFFTGSDWCHWCQKLEREVLSKPEFVAKAKDKWELVYCDFPEETKLPKALSDQNETLKTAFDVKMFPTAVALDRDGHLVATLGYNKGGPKKWLEYAEREIALAGVTAKYIKPFDDEYNRLDDAAFAAFKKAQAAVKGVDDREKRAAVYQELFTPHLQKLRDYVERLSAAEIPEELEAKRADLLEAAKHVIFALENEP